MVNVKDPKFLKALGQHIRMVRLAQGLSQEDLAGTAEIALSQVGRIERGETNPTISTLYIISQALDISLIDLFNFKYPNK